MSSSKMIKLMAVLMLSLVGVGFCKTKKHPDHNNGDFDFFYFVLQWPGTYCEQGHKCCYPDSGKPTADFHIHGLWPNYNDGSYPSNCDTSNTFDESQLDDDLENRLVSEWPSFTCPSIGRRFWAHEWNKHGTCAESIFDQAGYFNAALELKDRADLLQALKDEGIEPSDDEFYNAEDIKEAMKKKIGFYPWLECNHNKNGKSHISQVYICVDRNGKNFIKCPVLPHGNCPSRVQLPSF